MFFYHLKNSIRLLKKHIGFASLNMLGLSIGLVSCLLIILFVNFELGFDRFHKNGENIYRVVMKQPGNLVRGSSSDWWIVAPAILKPTWESEFPEIDQVSRTRRQSWTFKLEDEFVNERLMAVDPEFFDIFSFGLKSGNKSEVFKELYSIVISQEKAQKYFGDEDPVSKIITRNDGKQFFVSGVLENIPNNSHLQFDMLISFPTLESVLGRSVISENWLNNGYPTYLTMHENTDLEAFDAKLTKYDITGFNDKEWSFHLQPLYDIHFNRQIRGTGDMGTIMIFISIGIFILLIACFNYINLYIAHYREHTKYISIKKVVGASRKNLVQQFMNESLLMVLLSYAFSVFVVWLVLPFFNDFLGQELEFNSIWQPKVLLLSLGIVVLMALISGLYPAILLARTQLTNAMKGGIEKLSKNGRLIRKSIVVIQFSVSILLIVFTLTVFGQLKFTASKSLGHRQDQIIYFSASRVRNNLTEFKHELLKNPNIAKVSASSGIPSRLGWSNIPIWEEQVEGDNPFFYRLRVDFDFMELYEIGMQEGRIFSREVLSDDGNAYILNNAAVKRLNFKNPVGEGFGFNKKMGIVVGVCKDFHFESLHKPITPLGIGVDENNYFSYISVKLNSSEFQETMVQIEDIWKQFAPNSPFVYYFLDERLERLYEKDKQLSKSLKYFSLMALIISCLGIFGLMSFSLREKSKEIGIRNVLGSTFLALFGNLTQEIIGIIAFATVLGGALGWYLSNSWLNNFAYRFSIGWDIIVLSAIITLLMTLLPISYRLFKSIKASPIDSLRTE